MSEAETGLPWGQYFTSPAMTAAAMRSSSRTSCFLPAFIAAFSKSKKLSRQEVEQLQALIDSYGEE